MSASNSCYFLLFIFLRLVILTISQQTPLYYYCNNDNGNYTFAGDYSANLDNALFAISSNSAGNGHGFYSFSAGNNIDTIHAIALCRGDISLDNCMSCVNESTTTLPKLCPNQKEAVVWYDLCMLKYSNRSIYGNQGFSLRVIMINTQNASNVSQFNEDLGGLLRSLSSQAASGGSLRKFATENVTSGDFTDIYGLAQCTPDLSERDCNNCLQTATQIFPSYCYGRRGARVISPSCTLRYEIYKFFDSVPDPLSSPPQSSPRLPPPQSPPQPPPPGELGDDHSNLGGDNEDKSKDLPLVPLHIIRAATQEFSDENKLGQGGFGPVYKGTLMNGKEIAVKRLSKSSGQGLQEFKNEVMLIARLQHRNLVRLLGCCLEGDELLLIYEYMPNKSLDFFLFDSTRVAQLQWKLRLSIISGIARGLLYLHEDSRLKIIHRDLKASNVLLDHEMNPKISDFGMARIFQGNDTTANTNRIVGTYGYMAPEYAMEGLFSVKSDVFSFGVLLLEIISGKKNSGFHQSQPGQNLLNFAWKLWLDGRGLDLMDPTLGPSSVMAEVLKCTHIGLLCVQEDPGDRPTMSMVVVMLQSETISLPQPKEPPFSVGRVVPPDNKSSMNVVTLSKMSPR
ncbi:Serine-threonine/tyrosine-protein kinase, catalytic domain [Dillenia turbinata]|uniref:non-specific serine/threonine protein kinase n=1 Tax=Dillenia turbinata TaxID=194707 RepID=A0AAN8UIC6_9MAGN